MGQVNRQTLQLCREIKLLTASLQDLLSMTPPHTTQKMRNRVWHSLLKRTEALERLDDDGAGN